ncbi:MAG: sulfotransferase [Pseudomonadota bacterium]|nr:sulfotransferase [Pseudomonadota bacterium]
MQIIILGMHRSGTSVVTRMVNMMGAYVGPEGSLLGFTRDNPKGYWERKDVIQCNIGLFRLYNATWPNIMNWPLPHRPRELPPQLENDLRTLVMNLDSHRPWVIKDPRLCLTLPYWKKFLEVPVAVIVYRDPLEIAQSLFMREKDSMAIERGIALWEYYAIAMLQSSAGMPRVFVSHAEFLQHPVEAAAKFYAALTDHGVQGLRLPRSREITAFIDPALYRSKPSPQNRETYALTKFQQELAEMLQGKRPVPATLTLSAESKKQLAQPVAAATA